MTKDVLISSEETKTGDNYNKLLIMMFLHSQVNLLTKMVLPLKTESHRSPLLTDLEFKLLLKMTLTSLTVSAGDSILKSHHALSEIQ